MTKLNEIDCVRVVHLVISELRAEAHPLLIWSHHDKLRARPGGGANHLHLVLGHVSPVTFRALDMRNYVQRLHKVMAVAAYEIEGATVLSPSHRAIVAWLSKEGRGDVAAWLTDLAATTTRQRRTRMTDAMRRSAAAVGFELPSFQAEVERLWVTGASEQIFIGFLSSAGVSVQRGDRSPHAILLYRGDILVGVMNQILGRPSFPVYEEAMLRFPGLADKPMTTAVAFKKTSKEVATLRQETTDRLEAMLRYIRREALDLTYAQKKPPYELCEGRAERIADRLKRLSRGAAIFEASIDLLWEDERWVSAPIEKLLAYSKHRLTSNDPSWDTKEKAEMQPGTEGPAGGGDEEEMSMGHLVRR